MLLVSNGSVLFLLGHLVPCFLVSCTCIPTLKYVIWNTSKLALKHSQECHKTHPKQAQICPQNYPSKIHQFILFSAPKPAIIQPPKHHSVHWWQTTNMLIFIHGWRTSNMGTTTMPIFVNDYKYLKIVHAQLKVS